MVLGWTPKNNLFCLLPWHLTAKSVIGRIKSMWIKKKMCCGLCTVVPSAVVWNNVRISTHSFEFTYELGYAQVLRSFFSLTPEYWVLLFLWVKSCMQALVFSSRPGVMQQNCVCAWSYFHLCAGCPLGVWILAFADFSCHIHLSAKSFI